LVTASNDKTVRVWSLPDGRLLKTLRLPLDFGDIGKSHAVAISPDGNTVAVGGDTGNQRPHNIFLFDRDLGELIKRIPDLPDAVLDLAYSTDGQRLVASLQGRQWYPRVRYRQRLSAAAERCAIQGFKLLGDI
jgi:WD40 repeat protein